MFENTVLRRIFGHDEKDMVRWTWKDEVTGGWRKLGNEELHNLYSLPNINMMIKTRRMRRAGHVARMGKLEVYTKFWFEIVKGEDHWEDLSVDGRIIVLK
jgi:hypothetical protein